MSAPLLSIVVIGRNEGARLQRCLESVHRMHGLDGEKELIYVDSASTDGSLQIAADLGAMAICLTGGRQCAARARNAGLAAARAPFILFLDGDTILNPDFPRLALRTLETDDQVAAVWGNLKEIHPERSIYNRTLDLEWICPPGETEVCGGNVLMRKAALDAVEGYDSTLIAGEEPELCRRLRARSYRILHIDAPMAGHDLSMLQFSQYWKRSVRTGYAYAEVSTRSRLSGHPMWVNESKDNLVRGSALLLSLAAGVVLLRLNPAVLVTWIAMLLLLSARSGWKVKWKAPGKAGLLLLYGFHSHMQQIPIFFGQLQYFRDKRAGKQRKLIEYKEGSNG